MTSKEFVEALDWESAIVAATLELEPLKPKLQAALQKLDTAQKDLTAAKRKQDQAAIKKAQSDKQKAQNALHKLAEPYLNRGIARCFTPDKEGKHKEAIEDLSKAIVYGADTNKAYYYRAYAFYLDGNYEKAIEDCWHIKKCPRKDELLGKIYITMSKNEEAVKRIRHAIKWYNQKSLLPPSGLLDSYREACKKMNSV